MIRVNNTTIKNISKKEDSYYDRVLGINKDLDAYYITVDEDDYPTYTLTKLDLGGDWSTTSEDGLYKVYDKEGVHFISVMDNEWFKVSEKMATCSFKISKKEV